MAICVKVNLYNGTNSNGNNAKLRNLQINRGIYIGNQEHITYICILHILWIMPHITVYRKMLVIDDVYIQLQESHRQSRSRTGSIDLPSTLGVHSLQSRWINPPSRNKTVSFIKRIHRSPSYGWWSPATAGDENRYFVVLAGIGFFVIRTTRQGWRRLIYIPPPPALKPNKKSGRAVNHKYNGWQTCFRMSFIYTGEQRPFPVNSLDHWCFQFHRRRHLIVFSPVE